MKITGLKTEERITPEGIEMKFIFKYVIDTLTSVNLSDIFEKEPNKGSD
ncbi:hypothetical protein LCGC14_1468720 [marine sediment metagenome]|uniref:Uncharacterized protein n=1 Tax=marine sediment metagenome TaxID=412755 RepID=A0A0F9MEU0_9ZZZZ